MEIKVVVLIPLEDLRQKAEVAHLTFLIQTKKVIEIVEEV
jgi:hypothetical protein